MRKVSLFLSVLMILQCLMFSAFSQDAAADIKVHWPLGESSTYRIGEIGGNPLSFEAVVQFPTSYLTAGGIGADGNTQGGIGGMIFGNVDGRGGSGSFGIYRGTPILDWYDQRNNFADNAMHYNVLFTGINPADVYSGKEVHIAIVRHHSATEMDYAMCYVSWVGDDGNVLGGDLRGNNERWFRGGSLYEVAVYNEVKSKDDMADYFATGIDEDDDSLLSYFNLRDCETVTPAVVEATVGNDAVRDIKWFKKAPKTDYVYSMALVGDTQILVEKNPGDIHHIYDWLINNKVSNKIEYVIGLGDITNTSAKVEYDNAKAEIFRLDDVYGENYLAIRGNHDKTSVTSADKKNGKITYDAAFKDSVYASSFTGKMRSDSVLNAYKVANISGVPYLFLALDYGAPDNYYTEDGKMNVLEWASSVVEQYPNHNVIVATHGYLDIDGEPLDGDDRTTPDKTYKGTDITNEYTDDNYLNNGMEMWEKFISKHDNICFVVSGHIGYDQVIQSYRERKDENGNVTSKVAQILTDHQATDAKAEGPFGMITMLYFNGDGSTVSLETFSSVRAANPKIASHYFFESNQYDFELDLKGTRYDVTGDNLTTVKDVIYLAKYLLDGTGTVYDTTGDGKITLADVLRVASYTVNK